MPYIKHPSSPTAIAGSMYAQPPVNLITWILNHLLDWLGPPHARPSKLVQQANRQHAAWLVAVRMRIKQEKITWRKNHEGS